MGRQSKIKAERRRARDQKEQAAASRREAKRLARARGAEAGSRRGCLICRRSDGGFETEEHIVPESLGNTEKILPPGVVCDRCNNGLCASLDEALCTFGPIQMLRTLHQQPNKAGKLPSMKFDNGRLGSPEPGSLWLDLASKKWHRDLPSAPGTQAFSFTAQRSGDITPERLALVHRALVKQALEFVWLDSGERALSAAFDRERTIVLEGGHHGYLITPRHVSFLDGDFRHGMEYLEQQRVSDGHPLLFFVAWFWGVPIATDSLFPEPQGMAPDDFQVWTF